MSSVLTQTAGPTVLVGGLSSGKAAYNRTTNSTGKHQQVLPDDLVLDLRGDIELQVVILQLVPDYGEELASLGLAARSFREWDPGNVPTFSHTAPTRPLQ